MPQPQTTTDSSDHYWPPSSNTVTEVSSSGYTSLQNCVTVSQPSPMLSSTVSSGPEGSTTALKDFNSAFRTAPGGSAYSLPDPVAPAAIVTSADLTSVSDGLSSLTTLTTTTSAASEGSSSSSSVGINWGSVLSLGTGHGAGMSDLDCPMNNNLNTDGSWNSTSSSSSVVSSLTSADLDAFDDIRWKLGGGPSSGNGANLPTVDDIVALKTFQGVDHHQGAQQQQPTM